MKIFSNKKGFTLVELILYVAIGSIILLIITSFFQTNLSSRAKVKSITEVDQQGAYLMQTITQTIVNAEAINSPSIGTSATTLSLDVVDVADDPTL
ncbi:prepilin-type N-terminal cleavage/methylation domain-containing protein, partial [bacterium]|nr:prepilin-type N-terminal cleavage/methylation domain-containing protein [bacterium]